MIDPVAPEEGRHFYRKAAFEKGVDQRRTPRDRRRLRRICRQAVPHLPSRTGTTTPAVEIATAISGKRREAPAARNCIQTNNSTKARRPHQSIAGFINSL